MSVYFFAFIVFLTAKFRRYSLCFFCKLVYTLLYKVFKFKNKEEKILRFVFNLLDVFFIVHFANFFCIRQKVVVMFFIDVKECILFSFWNRFELFKNL